MPSTTLTIFLAIIVIAILIVTFLTSIIAFYIILAIALIFPWKFIVCPYLGLERKK
jgi:hypothetical protein